MKKSTIFNSTSRQTYKMKRGEIKIPLTNLIDKDINCLIQWLMDVSVVQTLSASPHIQKVLQLPNTALQTRDQPKHHSIENIYHTNYFSIYQFCRILLLGLLVLASTLSRIGIVYVSFEGSSQNSMEKTNTDLWLELAEETGNMLPCLMILNLQIIPWSKAANHSFEGRRLGNEAIPR